MQRARSFHFVLLFFSLAVTLPSAAQVTFATVQAGNRPHCRGTELRDQPDLCRKLQ